MKQVVLSKGRLLDEKGHLMESGYATSLVKDYSRKDIKAGAFGIKEWDYYLIYTDEYGVALTLDDNSYMGLISVTFLDFVEKKEHTVSPMTILPMGRTNLPSSSETGDVSFKNDKVTLSFRHVGNARKLTLDMADFDGGEPIAVDLELVDEPRDSMVIATPFAENRKAFYYNQKIIGMRARGAVKYKGKMYTFSTEDSYGLLDWGRGVWTYDNTWYWSAGQGTVEGKIFGFNLGYGFGDTAAATENMLFYDGVSHKLDNVQFHIPMSPDGKDDFLQPWNFTSSDGRFEATFTPILDRVALTSLKLIMSDQHQVFGHFDGIAILDDGTKILLNHFLGFAEKVRNKW